MSDVRLWCLHAIGPDDVHPAPDFSTAQKWADWGNQRFGEEADILRFVVAVWPWSVESHADGLQRSIANWTLPQPSPPEPERAVVDELAAANAEIERLRGLLIDPGSPAWEDARNILAAELDKVGMADRAASIRAGYAVFVPSHIALNLIGLAYKQSEVG